MSNPSTTIYLPVSYQDALKGAKAITVEQIKHVGGITERLPVIIPPLNTNIAFTEAEAMKYYQQPCTNIYNNNFDTPRQVKYRLGSNSW